MQYPKPTKDEMMQSRYAGDGRPNYEETKLRSADKWTDMANEGPAQPYYMYHKDRYGEHR